MVSMQSPKLQIETQQATVGDSHREAELGHGYDMSTNMEVDLPKEVIDPSDTHFVVRGREGPYLMDKSKWPTLILPTNVEGTERLTQEDSLVGGDGLDSNTCRKGVRVGETDSSKGRDVDDKLVYEEDIMDTLSNLSKSDLEDEDKGWQPSRPKKIRKKGGKQVMVDTRTSSRVPKDGISIADKAASRAMAKNSLSGIKASSNPFTILNNSCEVLEAVINDLNIVADDMSEQVSVFKAEEIARAALAEANYKVFKDRQKEKDKPHDDDLTNDLTMGVIDNSVRLVYEASSKPESAKVANIDKTLKIINETFKGEASLDVPKGLSDDLYNTSYS